MRSSVPVWKIGLFMRGCLPGSKLICEGRSPGSRLIFCRGCPPEEVFEEVLWRGGPVIGSTGLGGSGTIDPLAGAMNVPGMTCRA
ncbi:UNVERIFIED_CONTAM: hypothetical protein Sradi_0480900 [Sesamum radiatum]|uniref:Uncharacterized protein n=1 Tax=Sesamum radiatum TaxID=300843 RepID=A0AAW2WC73_SESRA